MDVNRNGKVNTRLKFCGMTRLADIQAANELKPEYIGFVFWEKSKRNVTRQQAKELKANLDPDIKAVGVFVDEEPETVAALLQDGIIDIAQLHGNEDEEYCARLRRLIAEIDTHEGMGTGGIGTPGIIKAFVIKSPEDIERAKKCTADYLLLDSGKGTGQTFNWELIKEAEFDKPFFLAGGLEPENVAAAIEALHPYAVDVSSGIETEGCKDPEKMRLFAKQVRNIDKCFDVTGS